MGNTLPSDAELLTSWLDQGSETAFRDLVSRYAGLVHQASLRVCHDESLAADTSQQVFILLARKARSLRHRTSLAGWLHHTAVMQAKNSLRSHFRESRKRQSLHAAMNPHPPSSSAWNEIRPALDEALSFLSEKDREILLLHYYRTLGIDQISSLLGIAAAAARKRLARATDRLRLQLARRGIHTRQSLPLALTAGFALDAQSTLPSAKLASTALSSATAATTQTGTTLILLTAMKSTWLPPVAALLIALLWLAPKHHALSSIERKADTTENLRSRSAHSTSSDSSARPRTDIPASSARQPIDWQFQANHYDTSLRIGLNMVDNYQLEFQLSELSSEELLEQLDILARSDIRPDVRRRFEYEIARQLAVYDSRDPEFALAHLLPLIHDHGEIGAFLLPTALGRLAKTDPGKAVAWLDLQIASGGLETRWLGPNPYREDLEKSLFSVLFLSHPEIVSARLEKLTEAQRIAIIKPQQLNSSDAAGQIAFANFARQYLPEGESMRVIASLASGSYENYSDYAGISETLDRIEATEAEREASIESAATSVIERISSYHKVTAAHIDQMRAWLGEYYPEKVARVTGEALASAQRHAFRNLSLSEAAEFAIRYDAANGGNEVLSAFLDHEAVAERKIQLRSLAQSTTNGTLRREILNRIDTP